MLFSFSFPSSWCYPESDIHSSISIHPLPLAWSLKLICCQHISIMQIGICPLCVTVIHLGIHIMPPIPRCWWNSVIHSHLWPSEGSSKAYRKHKFKCNYTLLWFRKTNSLFSSNIILKYELIYAIAYINPFIYSL